MHNKPTTNETNIIKSIFNHSIKEQVSDLVLGGVYKKKEEGPTIKIPDASISDDGMVDGVFTVDMRRSSRSPTQEPIIIPPGGVHPGVYGNDIETLSAVAKNAHKQLLSRAGLEAPEPMFPEDKPTPKTGTAKPYVQAAPEPIFPETKPVSPKPKQEPISPKSREEIIGSLSPEQAQKETAREVEVQRRIKEIRDGASRPAAEPAGEDILRKHRRPEPKGGHATKIDPSTGRTDTSRNMMPANSTYTRWSEKEPAIVTTVAGSKQDPVYVAQQQAKAEATRNPAKNVSGQIQTALKLTGNNVRLSNKLTDAAVEAGIDLATASKEQLAGLMGTAQASANKMQKEIEARRTKTTNNFTPTPEEVEQWQNENPYIWESVNNSETYYEMLCNKLNEEKSEPSGAQVNQAAYGFDPKGGRNARKALASLKSGMWRGDSTTSGKIKSETKLSPIDSQFQPSWGEKLKPHVITLMSAAQDHKIELSKEEAVNPGSKDHQRLLSMYPKDHDVHKASRAVGEIMRSRSNA